MGSSRTGLIGHLVLVPSTMPDTQGLLGECFYEAVAGMEAWVDFSKLQITSRNAVGFRMY